MTEKKDQKRTIRSFVRREGRITPGQKKALETLWPKHGVEIERGMVDYQRLFHRSAPVTFEIGFGMGESLLNMAEQNPAQDFIGIDVHRPGIGTLLANVDKRQLQNVRVFNGDAKQVLQQCIPDASLERVLMFFPDPWPKKRHHKRRLLQMDFAELVVTKLRPNGIFHLATDWEDYAQHMLHILENVRGLKSIAARGQFSPRPAYRPLTKFELRGQRLGHGVWDLIYRKVDVNSPN